MKAKVDKEVCAGTGACAQTCPKVFKLDGNVAKVIVDEVQEEAQEDCRAAMEGCPTGAISIEE